MTDATKILEALQTGKKVQWCADAFGWPRQQIVALINGKPGWLFDSDRDTVRIFRNDDTTGEQAAPELAPKPLPAPDLDLRPKVVIDAAPAPADKPISNLEGLLRRGDQSDTAATRAAAKKTRAAVEDLRQRIKAEDAEKQIRDRIAGLQEQLAAAEEQLHSVRPGKKATSTRPSTVPHGVDSKDIRAWAKKHDIPCPALGRIPKTVVDKYLTAHRPADA
jgi:hypothetical protein